MIRGSRKLRGFFSCKGDDAMRIRKILELSVDLADPVRETQIAIRAVMETLRTQEDQVNMARTIREDIDSFLKGVETREQPLPNARRDEKDK